MKVLGDKIAELYLGPLTNAFRSNWGVPAHVVEDSVSALFANRALTRQYYERWQASGKRLRDYLWGGVVMELLAARRAARRGGARRADVEAMVDTRSENPADEYRRGVMKGMVWKALRVVEKRCEEEGKVLHWQLFRQYAEEEVSMRIVSERLGIPERKGEKLLVTMRRWFEKALEALLLEDGVKREDLPEAVEEIAGTLGRRKKK